ncbi:methionyl-tRNA formyltransferase [Enterococcus faecium]|uniref:methionyl-tRNA formyltransferase n=1 Tax=Enterococcus faecium TaxID=1352 RepID=UPI000A337433|nr:formyltransferase family protein [Enterococcus faecium]OTN86757.1 hypothetical protein A5809_002856 [Enterococcus faecium]
MTQKFKVIFFSEVNSKFGMPFFEKIYTNKNFEIVAFVTTPVGELCSYYVGETDPVDLESYALSKEIPIYRPNEIKSDSFCEKLKQYNPDYIIIANYQKILGGNLISLPRYDTLNFHPSPLPKYAGLSPFFWMARNTERESGVSCIKVSPMVDGGDIVAQLPVKLTGNETTLEIRSKLFKKSLSLLDKVLGQIIEQSIKTNPQNITQREYFSKPTISDKTITQEMTVSEALAILKACAPDPGILNVSGQNIKVNAVSWVPSKNVVSYQLTDGKLYFLPEREIDECE